MREQPARPGIKIVENGPYRVTGAPLVRMRPLYSAEGDGIEWERGRAIEVGDDAYDLCRCGRSASKPFCDGTEATVPFDGTEIADRRSSAERRRDCGDGPLVLSDDRSLCSHMSFCTRGGANAWTLAREIQDPESRETVMYMVRRCPSGRLLYRLVPDPDPVEEELQAEIGVVEDGPLWVRGGIPVEAADGFEYEVRNRVTLCRCGRSRNKPFCDGSHLNVGFKDP